MKRVFTRLISLTWYVYIPVCVWLRRLAVVCLCLLGREAYLSNILSSWAAKYPSPRLRLWLCLSFLNMANTCRHTNIHSVKICKEHMLKSRLRRIRFTHVLKLSRTDTVGPVSFYTSHPALSSLINLLIYSHGVSIILFHVKCLMTCSSKKTQHTLHICSFIC